MLPIRKVNAMNNCQVEVLTKVIIISLNASTGKLLTVTAQHINTIVVTSKIVSEYDQEIPQSQTADNPKTPRGRATQPSRDTKQTN